MKKLRTKNLIAFILAVIFILSFVPNLTVVADDKEDIEKGKYDSSEYYAYEQVNSNGWDAMGDAKRKEKIEAYKNDIPNIAKAGDKTVQEYLTLKTTERVDLIKKWRKDNPKNAGGTLTADELYKKVCPVHVSQGDGGCTITSINMLCYNSGCLNSDAQVAAGNYSYPAGAFSGWNVISYTNEHGDETFGAADTSATVYGEGAITGNGGGTVLVGTEKKLFADMTEAEFAQVIAALWNNGYYMVLCVRYKTDGLEMGDYGDGDTYEAHLHPSDESDWLYSHFRSSGGYGMTSVSATGKYGDKSVCLGGTHYVYCLGVAEGHIWVCDPYDDGAHNQLARLNDGEYWARFIPTYITCWKSDKMSPKKLSGNISMQADVQDGIDAGIIDPNKPEDSVVTINGGTFYKETDLTSFRKLDEANIQDNFLSNASRDNLGQQDVYSLTQWEQQKDKMAEESSLTKVTRVSLMILGIVLSVYFILLYIAYWLDRINNFIEVRFLELLTFRKLTLSDTEDDCTYEAKGLEGKLKTVNHKAIIKICILGEFMAVLLLTGVVYKFVLLIVGLVESIKIKLTS